MYIKPKVTHHKDYTHIVHIWFSWEGVLSFIAVLIFTYLGITSPANVDNFLADVLFPISVLLVFAYISIAYLFNRTQIYIGDEVIAVKIRPIPWLGNQRILVSDVKTTYLKETDHGKFAVMIKTRNHEDIKLAPGFSTKAHALVIKKNVDKYLRVQDGRLENKEVTSIENPKNNKRTNLLGITDLPPEENKIINYGVVFIVFHTLFSFANVLFIEHELISLLSLSFRYTLIQTFILALYLYLYWFKLPTLRASESFSQVLLTIALIVIIVGILNAGSVISVNALFGTQQEVTFNGEIVKKYYRDGKQDSYTITVKEYSSGIEKEFSLHPKEYRKRKVGQAYSEDWVRGSLGILYRHKP